MSDLGVWVTGKPKQARQPVVHVLTHSNVIGTTSDYSDIE